MGRLLRESVNSQQSTVRSLPHYGYTKVNARWTRRQCSRMCYVTLKFIEYLQGTKVVRSPIRRWFRWCDAAVLPSDHEAYDSIHMYHCNNVFFMLFSLILLPILQVFQNRIKSSKPPFQPRIKQPRKGRHSLYSASSISYSPYVT